MSQASVLKFEAPDYLGVDGQFAVEPCRICLDVDAVVHANLRQVLKDGLMQP